MVEKTMHVEPGADVTWNIFWSSGLMHTQLFCKKHLFVCESDEGNVMLWILFSCLVNFIGFCQCLCPLLHSFVGWYSCTEIFV